MEAAKVPKKRSTGAKKQPAQAVHVKPQAIPAPSLSLYKRIAGMFVLLVALVLVVVLFVSTTKATVQVTPVERVVESAFLVEVVPTAAVEGKVQGRVWERTFEQARTFEVAGGEEKEVLGKSGGTVTIVNESGRDQPLVATTRLLSSGGVLFRLDDGLIVPAGGRVEAVVHADQEGPTGDIGADRFTIPGLSTSLQSVIYATSDQAMSGGQRRVSVVSQEQLDAAAAELEAIMFLDAKDALRAEVGEANDYGEVFQSEVLEKQSDTLPGAESDQFVISLTLKVTGVFYDAVAMQALSEAKLFEALEKGFEFTETSIDPDISLQTVNVDDQTAELRISRTATSVVSVTHPALEKGSFIGQNEQEIRDRLTTAGLAADVEVDIFPPWVTTVPTLKDHIDVVIQ